MTVETGIRNICDLGLQELPELRDRPLEPGDLVLARTVRNPLSQLISRLDGWWTHTAISLGGGRVAHAHAEGITIDPLDELADHYPDGLAVARLDLDEAVRQRAADYAKRIATDLVTEYDAADLGVAFSLLKRAQRQPGLDELLEIEPEDDLESLGRRPPPDFSSTCSGFVYRCYLEGAGVALEIDPAPGIRVVGDTFVVPDRDALLDELRSTSDEEALEGVGIGKHLERWRVILGIAVEGTVSGFGAIRRDEPVPIAQGVTPMDIWTTEPRLDRWFIQGKDDALRATADCGSVHEETAEASPAIAEAPIVEESTVDYDNFVPEDYVTALRECNKSSDEQGATALVEALVAHVRGRDDAFPLAHAKSVLQLLRRRRWFPLMQQVADVLISGGQSHPTVRRQYAQALLDQSNVNAAIHVLERLAEDTGPDGSTPDDREHKEAQGLLGRAYKQQYVDADHPRLSRNRRAINRAIASYRDVHDNDRTELWHGINAVALMQRAIRDGVELEVTRDELAADAAARANQIVAAVQALDDAQDAKAWDLATGVEASVALAEMTENDARKRHLERASDWMAKYLAAPNADAFEYASTHRQLVEVWGLGANDEIGALLLPALSARGLKEEWGELTGAPSQLQQLAGDGLEKVFGREGAVTAQWFRMALERAEGVARILGSTGEARGTGFLVDGVAFAPSLAGELLIMTNNHVVSGSGGRLFPRRPRAQFEALGHIEVALTEIVWESPIHELDATLLRFEGDLPDRVSPISDIEVVAKPGGDGDDEQAPRRAYVIGHPEGRPTAISIHDNVILDHDDTKLHYRSPTEPGSSGSPVFDSKWQLIALHHAGKEKMARLNGDEGFYQANEGLLLNAICDATAAALG